MTTFVNGIHSMTVKKYIRVDLERLVSENDGMVDGNMPLKYKSHVLLPFKNRAGEIGHSKITYFISINSPVYIVVLKAFNSEQEYLSEKKSLEKRQMMGSVCKSVIIKGAVTKQFMVMDYYDGDCLALINKTTNLRETSVVVARAMFQALECFHQKGLFHTDMKLDQLLYSSRQGEGIVLTDLELVPKGSKEYVATYPSPTFNNSKPVNLYDVEWSIMCTILSMFTNTHGLWSRYCGRVYGANGKDEWSKAARIKLLATVSVIFEDLQYNSNPLLDIAWEIYLLHKDESGKTIGFGAMLKHIGA